MRIPINRGSSDPLYVQIAGFLRQAIRGGNLDAKTRLPSSRRLASDLGVTRITVENAYAELEAEGLVARRVGSGSYVLPVVSFPEFDDDPPDSGWPMWQQEVHPRGWNPCESTPGPDGLGSCGHDMIDLACGVGDSARFPVDAFRKTIQKVLQRDGLEAVKYGDPRGYAPLRETIAGLLASQGLRTRPENVLVTGGSQQALALIALTILAPGDVIVVERPTYNGALDLFRSLGLKVLGAPTDSEGLLTSEIEPLLQRHHPRAIYTVANFANPTGACLTSRRRRELVALAERYNVPVIEDDFVGDLRYDGKAQPSIKAIDPGGCVIYVSTFSKMLMPGLRVGFLVVDGPVFDKLRRVKRVHDLATSNLNQRAVEAFVTVGGYEAHLRRSRHIYRRRRNTMIEAVDKHLPDGTTFAVPRGGLYLWLRLPDGEDSRAVAEKALSRGVSVAHGCQFFDEEIEGVVYMRLNFAASTRSQIERGVKTLGISMKA
ncbi:MAG: PLP-dependent aminotransferase family protein [bacterium]|nr:PLP-dependent aminotransferase family protein [bacterium]